MQTKVILYNVRSVYNVGSIFRTCDAAGIDEIVLCGYTPQPVDRFNIARSDLAKVALGAEKSVNWEYVEDIKNLIPKLQKEGFKVVAIEQNENSVDYKEIKVEGKIAFVFGNEPDGIEKEVLDKCDIIAEVPMKGEKESLNVSVTAGIALFRILDS
ncbi:MAG: TrmH family RNA methyltransferase [Candidatus Pacebacteria bacterium]|nr:TrmH family RNA methyltransferase [Candidatus Paceibacterota bacterium]